MALILHLRRAVAALSMALLVGVTVCYWGRYDWCAAVTIYPAWCWWAAGMVLLAAGVSRQHRIFGWRWMFSAVLLWCVFLVAFADTPTSMLRMWLPAPEQGHSTRVVTLNCASSADAAREIVALEPDIALLQESPGRAEIELLAEELFGSGGGAVWGPDASIIARGKVEQVVVPAEFRENFVHARVRLDDTTIEVISLRLFPSPVRMDLWNPRCWKVYRENRRKRRKQLSRLADYLTTIPADRPIVLGGDFNAPPGDAVFRLLRPRLADSFALAGRGWGTTFMTGLPVLRIDQIWTSDDVLPLAAFAHPTRFSDHRMAVADVALEKDRHPR